MLFLNPRLKNPMQNPYRKRMEQSHREQRIKLPRIVKQAKRAEKDWWKALKKSSESMMMHRTRLD